MATKITGTVSGEPLIEVEIGGVYVPWKQGIANWAQVTAVTGSPTTGTYTDANGVEWKYYRWSSSGSVTTTAGVVDALVAGGGGSGAPGANGSGAQITTGLVTLASGTKTVTVGAGGTSSYGFGGSSVLGSIIAGGGNNTNGLGSAMTPNLSSGTSSSITGSSVTYCVGATGGTGTTAGSGAYNLATAPAGTVIIRVPSQFALV